MVGICRWQKPTSPINDIFPPWWDFVMWGICRKAMIIIIINIIIIITSPQGSQKTNEPKNLIWDTYKVSHWIKRDYFGRRLSKECNYVLPGIEFVLFFIPVSESLIARGGKWLADFRYFFIFVTLVFVMKNTDKHTDKYKCKISWAGQSTSEWLPACQCIEGRKAPNETKHDGFQENCHE